MLLLPGNLWFLLLLLAELAVLKFRIYYDCLGIGVVYSTLNTIGCPAFDFLTTILLLQFYFLIEPIFVSFISLD